MGGRLLKALGLVLLLGVGGPELYGRYVLDQKPGLQENHLAESLEKFATFDPVLGLAYRINVDQLVDVPSSEFSILFKINEIGLHDRPMGTHLRKELKFLVFGDEFAEGWGADIDQHFAVRAQVKVNEKTALNPPVRMVIAAKSSYGAAQNYLIAGPLIDSLQPKAIVFFYSSLMPHADALFLRDAKLVDGLATGLRSDVPQHARLPHLEDYAQSPPDWLASLARQSVAARMLAEWWALRTTRADLVPGDPLRDRLAGIRGEDAALKAIHAPSLRYVKALATLAASRHVPFLLVHVPLPPQVSSEAWDLGRQVFSAPPGLMPAADAAVVADFCKASGLRCLSLHERLKEETNNLKSTRLFYRSELALTVDGDTILGGWFADEIYRWLGELGYLT